MSQALEKQVEGYHQWRDGLAVAITAYQDWLDDHHTFEAQQSLKLFDLLESLKQDHVTLAFVAEFSRGKSELINALFFADFKQRLLPSDAGRTTMCPTELFYDAREEPFIRLLPIETRYTLALMAKKDHRLLPRLKRLACDDESLYTIADIANAAHNASDNAYVHKRTVHWDNVAVILDTNIARTTKFLDLSEDALNQILSMDPRDPNHEEWYANYVSRAFF